MTDDKANYKKLQEAYDLVNLENMKVVMGGQTKTVEEIVGEGGAAGSIIDETDTAYTWYVQQEFTKLLDVSQIEYIELDGVKYVK